MIRTFRYPLLPNQAQEQVFEHWLDMSRLLYNAALEQRRDAYRRQGKTLNYNYQTKDLTELRRGDATWRDIPVLVGRSALDRLQGAFDGFFRRIKAGQKPGYPRFQGRNRYDSFGVGRIKVDGNRVMVPKLGAVKFKKYREMTGQVRDATIRWYAGRWHVCFACEIGPAPAKISVVSVVGIDVGLTSFATLSTGEKIDNPRFFRRGEALLATRQRALRYKQRGSRSRERAKLLVQKAHAHVRNQRLDFVRKLAARLFSEYDLVAYENLNLQGMVKGFLSKSVADAAWGKLEHALVSKAECAGKWAVPVNPNGTSQNCSGCGTKVAKELSERIHRCSCGVVMDRDENAARNIGALGRSAVVAMLHNQSPPN